MAREDILGGQTNFRSLSLKDLLDARDLYHWQLINKANVVGTAVGLYLIRTDDPPDTVPRVQTQAVHPPTHPRTFDNAEVRPSSWPCVLVLVKDWVDASDFGVGGLDPDHMVPRTLYLPDGRAAPVCVVKVDPVAPTGAGPANVRWPDSYLGGGCPIVVNVQGAEHMASVGCLVTDGHKTYALTSRHVSGEAGVVIMGRVRGNLVAVGRASDKQLTRRPFVDVFPEFPGRRTFLTLDIGLIEVDNVNDWTSQPFGLQEPVGDVADLNELNVGLQLIDREVTAFGAASGVLDGKIKALFYRHAARAGYEFVSQFLIGPAASSTPTRRGDSGTVWHLRTVPDPSTPVMTELRPIAVEWGGQAFAGTTQQFNFALASGLSTACELLEVDLVQDHNTGPTPFWGQTGHYSIAAAAVDAVTNPDLRALLQANIDRISFRPDQLTPEQIHAKLANGDFVELADVPDLVWKKTPQRVPGGRDFAQNTGPEHPNHYADIDAPDARGGPTLRDLTLASGDLSNMRVAAWNDWYAGNGKTDWNAKGLLPFRVWQFFTLMVDRLKAGDVEHFVCAAGAVSHYVGDACQPLHGSYHADGYRERADAGATTWPGKGVHSTYEDKMVDRFSAQLLALIGPQAQAFNAPIEPISTGQAAALATVQLMDHVAKIIPPTELCDEYIRLGGGTSRPVVDGLWKTFGPRTGQVMGAGARYLAAVWDAAYAAAAHPAFPPVAVDEAALAAIYQRSDFAPSLSLDKIEPAL